MNFLCIIPARAGSKRLKKKNIINFFGKPIIEYTLDAAIKANIFKKIIISTDINFLKKKKYEGIEIISRNKTLSNDKTSVEEVCKNVLDYEKQLGITYDYFCCLLATSPLRNQNDILACKKKILKKKVDFVMATTDYYYNPYESLSMLKSGRLRKNFRRENNEKTVVDNGSLYFCDTKKFLKCKTFYGPNLYSYHMSRKRSLDLNNYEDLDILKIFYKDEYL